MGLLLAAWVTAAWAGTTPMVALTGHGTGEGGDDGLFMGAGGGVTAGLRAVGPLWIELDVDAGWLAAGGARIGVAPALRVFLQPQQARFGRFSLTAGGGVDLLPAAEQVALPLLQAGAAVDLYVSRDWAVRIDGTYLNHLVGPGAGRGGVGVVWSPRKPPEPDVVEPDTRIWLPYPVCAWRDRGDAVIYLRALRQAELAAESGGEALEAAQAPSAPRLFGVGLPGDVVIVDGAEGVAGADGVVGVAGVDGFVQLVVLGGGRRVVLDDVLLVDGQATWVRAPPPTAQRVLFAAGSAELSEEAQASLAVWAAHTGVWRWRVAGSHSEEGTVAANEALALRRAEAVRDLLVAAGVPRAAIDLGPSLPPDPALSTEEQRSVVLLPTPPDAEGGAP